MSSELWLTSAVLDPGMKKLLFVSKSKRKEVWAALTSEVEEVVRQRTEETKEDDVERDDDEEQGELE